MKAAKKENVSNPHLKKAANQGGDYRPSPNVGPGQPITIKKTVTR